MFTCFSTGSVFPKLLLSTFSIMTFQVYAEAQNVGIGTNNPTRKLSVSGSVVVDHANQNNATLDSAALVFGSAGQVGISSNKVGPGPTNGLNVWTGSLPRLTIAAGGNIGIGGVPTGIHKLRIYGGDVGVDSSIYIQRHLYAYGNSAIGGDIDPAFKLRVYGISRFHSAQTSGSLTIGGDLDNNYLLRVVGGNTRFGGDMHATGNVALGGEVDPDYRLRVIGGNSRFGGDMHATGNVAFGGLVDQNFRLRVHNGESYFGGSVQISGHLNAYNIGASGTLIVPDVTINNSLTIAGKGSVRSNGPSSLRIGFDQKTVDVFILAGSATVVNADITDFSGDNDDVRVFVSQIESNSGNNLAFANLHIAVTDLDAGTNTCSLSLKNLSNLNANLKATIYLTTIAKN